METNNSETLKNQENTMDSNTGEINNLTSESTETENQNMNEYEEKIKELQLKLEEMNDKNLRLLAEFDNYRRRVSKEKVELMTSAGKEIFRKVLPVVDDFERAIEANKNVSDSQSLSDGFVLIHKQMKSVLSQEGVLEMEISKGTEFNSDVMEAITGVAVEEEELKGKVVDVLEKGYLLNGNVIRFAKVVIGA